MCVYLQVSIFFNLKLQSPNRGPIDRSFQPLIPGALDLLPEEYCPLVLQPCRSAAVATRVF